MTIAINWRRIQFHFFNDFKPKKKFWKRRRKTIIEKKNDKSTSFFYSINLCNVEVFDMEHRSGIKTKVYFLFFFFFSFVSFRVSLLFHKKKREEERRRRFFFYFKNKTKKKKWKSKNQSINPFRHQQLFDATCPSNSFIQSGSPVRVSTPNRSLAAD